MAHITEDLTGFVLNERYEFREKIQPGTYSTVYIIHDRKAENKQEERKAAKVIPQMSLSQNVATEAKILLENQHPNVVKVYDGIYVDGRFFVIMEYCNNQDLEKVIARRKAQGKTFSESKVIKWIIQLLQGIKFIHDRGIIHRDIKPRNILVHGDDVKLGDFGVSRVLTDTTDDFETIVGTAAYMSPETIRSEGYNQKYDIWALGCVLYELVAQTQAFTGTNIMEVFHNIVSMKIPKWPNQYSTELYNIFKRTLHADPSDRPTAQDLLNTTLLCSFMDSEGNYDEHKAVTPQSDLRRLDNMWRSSIDMDEEFMYQQPTSKNTTSLRDGDSQKLERTRHVPKFSLQTLDDSQGRTFSYSSDVFYDAPRLSPDTHNISRQEHVVNFIVRQKLSDPESIYIDCCKKDLVVSRLSELQSVGYTKGPMKSKDIVLNDLSLVYVTTTGPVQLEIDGTGIHHFELLFDSDLDNAGEEGWLVPIIDENSTRRSQRGFINFAARRQSLTSRERRRSASRINTDEESVLLCSLPIVINVEDPPERVHFEQSSATSLPPVSLDTFWNPVVSLVHTLRGDQWVELAKELDYDTAKIVHFQSQGDRTEAISSMLLDWFRRNNQQSDKIETLGGALKTIGLQDVASALIDRDQKAKEDRRFRRVVEDLVEDARLLLEQDRFLRLLGLSDADILDNAASVNPRSLKGTLRHGVMLWRCQRGAEASVNRIVQCLEEMKMLQLAESIMERHQGT